jgi:hypothetical protein
MPLTAIGEGALETLLLLRDGCRIDVRHGRLIIPVDVRADTIVSSQSAAIKAVSNPRRRPVR